MLIADTRSFDLGPYRVQQRPRPDNPAWPVYVVFRREKLIGKSFSIPDLGCCRWLERWGDQYAEPAPAKVRDYGYTALNHRRKVAALARARRAEEPEPTT